MIFSSAYAAVMGVLPPLISDATAVISDELNHNCIINAVRLSRPAEKYVYPHLDMAVLEESLAKASETCRRAIIVTDGVFSMRGDHAPLHEISVLAHKYDSAFPENVLVVVDDSHGVGAFGATGRGTEEFSNSPPVDLLVATLGKAFGVNGGYVTGSNTLIGYSTDPSGLPHVMAHRKKYLSPDHTPPSTWLVISQLANPQLVVEMETIAAKAD